MSELQDVLNDIGMQKTDPDTCWALDRVLKGIRQGDLDYAVGSAEDLDEVSRDRLVPLLVAELT